MMIGGFMLSEPLTVFNFIYFVIFLVLPASLGVAVGSIPIYLIVRYGLTINNEKNGRLQKIIGKVKESSAANEKGSIAMFFLMRLLPNFSGLIATIIGGLWNIPIKTFFIFTFLGSIIRITVIGFIGWQASNYAYIFTGKYGLIGFSSGIVLILFLSIIIFYRKK